MIGGPQMRVRMGSESRRWLVGPETKVAPNFGETPKNSSLLKTPPPGSPPPLETTRNREPRPASSGSEANIFNDWSSPKEKYRKSWPPSSLPPPPPSLPAAAQWRCYRCRSLSCCFLVSGCLENALTHTQESQDPRWRRSRGSPIPFPPAAMPHPCLSSPRITRPSVGRFPSHFDDAVSVPLFILRQWVEMEEVETYPPIHPPTPTQTHPKDDLKRVQDSRL